MKTTYVGGIYPLWSIFLQYQFFPINQNTGFRARSKTKIGKTRKEVFNGVRLFTFYQWTHGFDVKIGKTALRQKDWNVSCTVDFVPMVTHPVSNVTVVESYIRDGILSLLCIIVSVCFIKEPVKSLYVFLQEEFSISNLKETMIHLRFGLCFKIH